MYWEMWEEIANKKIMKYQKHSAQSQLLRWIFLCRFEDQLSCESTCIKPLGTGKCYLPKVTGAGPSYYDNCQQNLTRYYYNRTSDQCEEFLYTGCLGNQNNFESIEECQKTCKTTLENEGVCAQLYEPGPCRYVFYQTD